MLTGSCASVCCVVPLLGSQFYNYGVYTERLPPVVITTTDRKKQEHRLFACNSNKSILQPQKVMNSVTHGPV